MAFFVCGLNHKTAPLSIREQMTRTTAIASTVSPSALHGLIHEVVYLSTCNRTEIYCEADTKEAALSYFSHLHGQVQTTIAPYLYLKEGQEAFIHTLRVAIGLDSMMIGEPQIFGQLKQAFQNALETNQVGANLKRHFQFIFSAAKRIRHQSGISKNPISVASVAAQFVKSHHPEPQHLSVLLIGSGDTAHLVAKYLYQMGVRHFTVASRTKENAIKLAKTFDAETVCITDIPQVLEHADVVITATACPVPFINKDMVLQALQKREFRSILMLDLAVPRDIEPDVATLSHVYLLNVDDLHFQIEQGLEARREAAKHAELLLNDALEEYALIDKSMMAKGAICDYRTQMHSLAQQELERAMQKLNNGHDAPDVVSELCQRLVNKLTHYPTVGLRQAAIDGRDELLDLAQYLFNSRDLHPYYEEIT